MERYAIIVAGGKGLRFGADRPKQFLELQGEPILLMTLRTFLEAVPWDGVRIVLPSQWIEEWKAILASEDPSLEAILVEGGKERFQSVRNGLHSLPDKENALVAVHDAVRPLIRKDTIRRILEHAERNGNAVPAVPLKDSVRIIDPKMGSRALDRNSLRSVQTPQCFPLHRLIKAMEEVHREDFTDEASVMESFGESIHLCEGDPANIKITSREDLQMAEHLLEERRKEGHS